MSSKKEDQPVPLSVEEELQWRMDRWNDIKAEGDPCAVPKERVEELGIRAGGGGVFAYTKRTKGLPKSPNGVTLSLLHKGTSHDEDLSESGLIYHFERSNQSGEGLGKINSTKRAGELELPIFVITYPSKLLRDIRLGWVIGCDNSNRFFIAFGEEQPTPFSQDFSVDETFELFQQRLVKLALTPVRTEAQKFKKEVFARYGAACAFCGIHIPEFLEAAHIADYAEGSTDDPRNGLVLCANHHKAFDEHLVAIDPSDLSLRTRDKGPSLPDLRISRSNLDHLPNKPHQDALRWRYERWSNLQKVPR